MPPTLRPPCRLRLTFRSSPSPCWWRRPGSFGYRSLSEEILRDQRTLAVIAEQKRQHIEGWLAEARVDAQMVFSGHSQLEALFASWVDGGRRDDGGVRAHAGVLVEELVPPARLAGLALIDAGRRACARGRQPGPVPCGTDRRRAAAASA